MSLLKSFDYSKTALIPPPENREKNTRVNFLVIDSRDRDALVYPNSSNYSVDFDDPYTDIVSAELIFARLPLSDVNVAAYNDVVRLVSTSSPPMTFTLPHGLLGGQEIADLLNVAFSGLVSTAFSSSTRRFTLTSLLNEPFFLDLSMPNSAKTLLGFSTLTKKVASVYAAPDHVLTSSFEALTNQSLNYALMFIDNFNNVKSANSPTNNAFAVIDKSLTQSSGDDRPIAKKYFNPPLPFLQRLKVRFIDYYGNPYEFADEEHCFTLKLECMKNSSKYM